MIQKKVVDVFDMSQDKNSTVWCVYHQREDGSMFNYAFPAQALANHCAEYGLDPNDADTLLDVVLYQFHMDPAELHQDHPAFVWNTDEDTARQHHLARIAKLKTEIEFLDPDGKLNQIKQHHLDSFDSDKYQERRVLCRSIREHRMRELRKAGK